MGNMVKFLQSDDALLWQLNPHVVVKQSIATLIIKISRHFHGYGNLNPVSLLVAVNARSCTSPVFKNWYNFCLYSVVQTLIVTLIAYDSCTVVTCVVTLNSFISRVVAWMKRKKEFYFTSEYTWRFLKRNFKIFLNWLKLCLVVLKLKQNISNGNK